jgi:hypothetical protein
VNSRISRPVGVAAGITVVVVAVVVAVLLSGTSNKPKPKSVSQAVPPKLTATVSGRGQVTLSSDGRAVTRLRRGLYTVLVRVDSSDAGFRLTGPGVDHRTGPHFVGLALWGVHFVRGTYRYTDDRGSTGHVVSVY